MTSRRRRIGASTPRRQPPLVLALVLLLAPVVVSAQRADPCTDFYAYACGAWQAQHPVPPDRVAWGHFNELQQRGEDLVRDMLEHAAVDRPGRTATEQKTGDYYATCLDESGIERAGTQTLAGDFERIAAMRVKADLPDEIARLHRQGTNALFGFSSGADSNDARRVIAKLDQGGLGLPDRDYYLKEDATSLDLRHQYVDHVRRVFELLGDGREQAAAQAEVVMTIETGLATNAFDQTTRRDPRRVYHLLSLAELAALSPGFDWPRYFSAAGAPAFASLNVVEPEFVRGMNRLLGSTPLADWQTYLRWQVVHASATGLPSVFVNEDFRFFDATLRGAKELSPRWRRCVIAAAEDLGEMVGRQHVLETFGAEGKARTLAMVGALERALAADIEGLPWMSAETKKAALVKLHAMTNRIGYPDTWRDYAALTIVRGDALGNVRRARAWDRQRRIDNIGRGLDRRDWPFPPMTVNAGYDVHQNAITFPAGILQPPFFDLHADDASNFGAMGTVIGHELTHGFDDQGSRFDGDGNLREWWSATDRTQFEARTRCLEDQYGRYLVVDTLKLNGTLTLGENIADNGGLRLAYAAMAAHFAGREPPPVAGQTPGQRFFLGWANLWCENRTDALARKATAISPHAPGRDRVNGTVSNMPEFRAAYQCAATAPMVNQNVCRVW